jgi:hypothetical protein
MPFVGFSGAGRETGGTRFGRHSLPGRVGGGRTEQRSFSNDTAVAKMNGNDSEATR